jgi:polysaccharide export outer membrane protein
MRILRKREILKLVAVIATLTALGCKTTNQPPSVIPPNSEGNDPPSIAERIGLQKRETKVCLKDYRVEPPDILMIEAVRAVPKPPYKAEALDVLFISLAVPLPNEPLTGLVNIETDGTINLGITYAGSVSVVGKTIPEIKAAIEKHLAEKAGLKDPKVTVSLSQGRAGQRISGQHLVRPDGTVALGTYGSVQVVGMTLEETRHAIETHLSKYLLAPEIFVDVLSYNSKLYYVVLDGGGSGQTIIRLPITGNETVLDAIAQAKGLAAVSSKDRIWVSRPAPVGDCHQVLPVDWRSVVERGDTATNYQILPGDRVYVAAYPLTTADNVLARIVSPFQRIFSTILLGNSAVQSFNPNNNGGGIP